MAELEFVAKSSGCEVVRKDCDGNTTVVTPNSTPNTEMVLDPTTRDFISAMLLKLNSPITILESSWRATTKSGIKKGPGRYSNNKKPKFVTSDY
jgi:hypothetical protein